MAHDSWDALKPTLVNLSRNVDIGGLLAKTTTISAQPITSVTCDVCFESGFGVVLECGHTACEDCCQQWMRTQLLDQEAVFSQAISGQDL
eukprot:m.10097 g.10097  ORF g.10097 m.10097 type:complete len:90 (-) comp9580_c0_seq3:251-520(-)